MAGGWATFRRASSTSLKFFSPVAGRREPVWTIVTSTYPHEVVTWKNYVIWARGYLSDDGIIRGYATGAAKPTWTVDLNDLVASRMEPLKRTKLAVHGDTLFAQSAEQIFGINPRDGSLQFRYDLARDLGLNFRPDFWRGGVPDADIVVAGELLLVAYECRVIAMDRNARRYLWQLVPDTFPSKPRPVIGDGAVYMVAGPGDRLLPLDKPLVNRGSGHLPIWPLALLIAGVVALVWRARRKHRHAASC